MKKLMILSAIFIFLNSCQDQIDVTLVKEPGKITGNILPANVTAVVELHQGTLIQQVTTENGLFKFMNVEPGIYRILARAENFGRTDLMDIKVSDGEGVDVGILELSVFPYPLSEVHPSDGEINVRASSYEYRFIFKFSKHMISSSVEQAFQIDPEVNHIRFDENSSFEGDYHYYYFFADLDYSTLYTIRLDTTAETYFNEKLEFQFLASFSTEDFKIQDFQNSYNANSGQWPIRITFNGSLAENFVDHISIIPSIPYYIESSGYPIRGYEGRINVYPSIAWMPDTTITILINENLEEAEGAKLQQDTSFTFTVPALKVVNTIPYSNQHFVDTDANINIRMNNILDESSIHSAVSITPQTDYTISTSTYSGYTQFSLIPETLESDTEYTVSINSTLRDYFGGRFKQDYSFSFRTR